MLEGELQGKNTGVDELGTTVETPEEKRVCVLWKKGQATWGDYREVAKVCREEVRKAKAQLELRLPTEVKENKKSFYKYINGKRRTKENFHPLLDAAGNVTTEDKEKAEVLNAFFTSAFNRQISYPQGTLHPDLEVQADMWNCKRLFFYIIDSKFAEEQVQASPGQRQRNLLS